MNNAGEKYYYCPSCRKFHAYESDGHKAVSRKLCFFCDKKLPTKVDIVGDDQKGRTQICKKCRKEMAL